MQTWPLATALRTSIWVYPLVNAGHILGIAMLVGAIGTLDLRLLGLWSGVPVQPLARVLMSVAGAGLALAIMMGALLFVARANDYAFHALFQVKLICIALAILNLWLLHRHQDWQSMHSSGLISARVRIGAAVSLLLWLTVLLLGRLVGYR